VVNGFARLKYRYFDRVSARRAVDLVLILLMPGLALWLPDLAMGVK
jgi:hypothetical protein